jgi:hypothetical protein
MVFLSERDTTAFNPFCSRSRFGSPEVGSKWDIALTADEERALTEASGAYRPLVGCPAGPWMAFALSLALLWVAGGILLGLWVRRRTARRST